MLGRISTNQKRENPDHGKGGKKMSLPNIGEGAIVVCHSGGLDSSTALFWARAYFKRPVIAFNVFYGSKHNLKEREYGHILCQRSGFPVYNYFLPVNGFLYQYPSNSKEKVSLFSSNLMRHGDDIPEGHYAESVMSKTVVPFRNGVLLSLATGFAQSIGASYVVIGAHAGDHYIYPDCRIEFLQSMMETIQKGTDQKVKLLSPFEVMTKDCVIRVGLELGVPYEFTWSCYKGGLRPCFKCGTCVERTLSFLKVGVPDPALTSDEWREAVAVAYKYQGSSDEN